MKIIYEDKKENIKILGREDSNWAEVIIFGENKDKQLKLAGLDIESIGVKPNGTKFGVVIITSIAIKKLELNVTEKLETIGFEFSTLKAAVSFSSVLTMALWGDHAE